MAENVQASDLDLTRVPRHVAIIMDGNGRWAQQRGLPRLAGHRAGTENLRRILESCVEFGVKELTIYAFSTENWQRPAQEVNGLMSILERVIDRELDALDKQGVQIRHIGRTEGIRPELLKKIRRAVECTRSNRRLILNVAFNYGGRAEILDAARALIREGVDPDILDEATFSRHLYTAASPDPDLIIRTGGEHRLSNFLIWQAAYAEIYSTPTYWPDFDKEELRKAIQEFARRERRFGRLPPAKNGS
ncbi:MAG: polyprenyl diphosphate synthase [Ardenticatenaceae bacterium]|nr:polyprenyl diphosphate synthase [Ardenticatenaceae bacterium]HBY94562.1 di-trans,poly-cis-decaprenylcistransferase [Chloroflexota bacterium]